MKSLAFGRCRRAGGGSGLPWASAPVVDMPWVIPGSPSPTEPCLGKNRACACHERERANENRRACVFSRSGFGSQTQSPSCAHGRGAGSLLLAAGGPVRRSGGRRPRRRPWRARPAASGSAARGRLELSDSTLTAHRGRHRCPPNRCRCGPCDRAEEAPNTVISGCLVKRYETT